MKLVLAWTIILSMWFTPVYGSMAYVEFDPPLDPLDATVVLVSNTSGDYSHATGQQSEPGVGFLELNGVNQYLIQYLVAYRYNPITEEKTEFSDEFVYTPEPAWGTVMQATWWYPNNEVSGFRFYMDDEKIWEGTDFNQRFAEFVCTVYGDDPVEITMVAYDEFNEREESPKSAPFFITPLLPVGNVFQTLPWSARKRLCVAVKPSGNSCFLCHQ